MRELWSTLDSFHWPEGYGDFQQALVSYIAHHPEEREKLLALEERLATLAEVSEDAPEVEQLARDYAAFFEESTFSEKLFGQSDRKREYMGDLDTVLSNVAMHYMFPAQQRCMELLGERLAPGSASP